ncbi:MAG TPA: peptide chain release factor N(5)-glutamine methyltransferase [Candidatus Solibacter sp.]|nr:peptide chain release factor N(5)-glutamine methyltransferase [Candidatus Solibacter sp.]
MPGRKDTFAVTWKGISPTLLNPVISLAPIHMERTLDIRSALKRGIAELRDASVPSFTLAAELLLLHVLGRDRAWLYAHPEDTVSSLDAHRFVSLIARRAEGKPLQYLTGKQEFWGLEFEITPDVLIPRPETEHVIEVALDRLAVREIRAGRKQTLNGEGLEIADIGTGSGCIAIALAKELPQASFFASDISAAALAVARRNAARHGVADRIKFIESNLFDAFPAGARYIVPLQTSLPANAQHGLSVGRDEPRSFDLIVSNPPYVGRKEKESLMREVREHEPEIALYGGEAGYEFYADLIAESAKHLKAGGLLVLELGHNSLAAVQPLLDAPIWTNAGVTNDLAGIPRVIAAERI